MTSSVLIQLLLRGMFASFCPLYCQSSWATAQHFVLRVPNITCLCKPFILNIYLWSIVSRGVLSAIRLYLIKLLWQAIPNFWRAVLLQKQSTFKWPCLRGYWSWTCVTVLCTVHSHCLIFPGFSHSPKITCIMIQMWIQMLVSSLHFPWFHSLGRGMHSLSF